MCQQAAHAVLAVLAKLMDDSPLCFLILSFACVQPALALLALIFLVLRVQLPNLLNLDEIVFFSSPSHFIYSGVVIVFLDLCGSLVLCSSTATNLIAVCIFSPSSGPGYRIYQKHFQSALLYLNVCTPPPVEAPEKVGGVVGV